MEETKGNGVELQEKKPKGGKVTKVSFGRTIQTVQFENIRVDVEVEVGPDDVPAEAMKNAIRFVDHTIVNHVNPAAPPFRFPGQTNGHAAEQEEPKEPVSAKEIWNKIRDQVRKDPEPPVEKDREPWVSGPMKPGDSVPMLAPVAQETPETVAASQDDPFMELEGEE